SQGNFQLNVFKPVMLHDFLDAASLLAEALESFTTHCAEGIEPAREKIAENLEKNLMLVTALNPHIGYEKAAQVALKAHHEGLTLRQAALALGVVTPEQFEAWVRPEAMTGPLPR
ncbi:MAG: class II fumarate hydratase, partial [Acidocella sp.]